MALNQTELVRRKIDSAVFGGIRRYSAVFGGIRLNEEWWFSVIDICFALTDSTDAGAYWRKLKQRLNQEGSEIVTICHRLKLPVTA